MKKLKSSGSVESPLKGFSHNFLDNLIEGCQIIGPDWRYLYINEAAARQGRKSKEQLLGRTMPEVYEGIEKTSMFAALKRCMEKRHPHIMENEFIFPDGSKGWFELRFESVPEGVFILSLDITERKRTEAQISHLNALLWSIRKINRLVARERDPRLLIQKTCEVLVDSPGFITSCILVYDGNGLKFMADAGDSDKLEVLRHMLNRGDMPECINTILKETDSIVAQDIAETCRECPVSKSYFGRHEAIAVRLENEGKVYGALLVSVPSDVAPGTEDIELLQEMADDVAHALRSFEIQAQRDSHSEKLQAAQLNYHSLFENVSEGAAYCRMIFDGELPVDFIYLAVNTAFETKTGLQNVVGKRVTEIIPGIRESDHELFEIYGKVALSGEPRRFEIYVEALDDWFDISVYSPEREHFIAVFDVITERKREEKIKKVMVDLLKMINSADDRDNLLNSVLSYLKNWSGCEAVGIRIKDGDDFPYFETTGFPEEFVRLERHLCAYDKNGEVKRDAKGNMLLDCMCGNILQGRFDPEKSFFTADGSFWSNCTTELLATTTDADRQARTRNRCNGEGYESVALIPLRSGEQTLGLIQFNDKKKGRFTKESIVLYRWIADNIAAFLAKKTAEEARRGSEKRYRELVENMSSGVAVYEAMEDGKDFIFKEFNKAGEKIENLNRKDVIGKQLSEVFPGVKSYGLFDVFQRVYKTGRSEFFPEAVYKDERDPGTWRENWVYKLSNEEIVAVYDNVTERKRAEEEIKNLAKFPSENPNPVLRIDRKGLLIYANVAAFSMLSEWKLQIGETCPEIFQKFTEITKKYPIKTADISCGAHIFSVTAILIPEAEYINIYASDITKRTHVEEKLQKYRKHLERMVEKRTAELRATNKELEAFTYSVSHDLRAPLRAIHGFMDILMEDYVEKLDDEGKRLGSIIQQNTRKMGQLIDDLLSFSRMGRKAMKPSEIDMKNMVNAVYHEATTLEDRQKVKLVIDDLPKAIADSTMMRQVWMNLITNALKFSAQRKPSVISVTCLERENKFIYCVKDNGVGFDMKYKDKLFNVFQRLHSERDFPGTGVGLALVQRIIQRHGGKVWAEAILDESAVFYFSLPKKRR